MPKGYSPGRNNWTAEQLSALGELLDRGLSDEAIGRKLGRSAVAISVRRKRMRLAPRTKRLMSCGTVAEMFGLGCGKTVRRWIDRGWLVGRRGQRRGANYQWFITEEAVFDFMLDERTWMAWSPDRMPSQGLARWAREMRTDKYLSIGEVARRFFVQHSTVNEWCRGGLLPGVQYGNWWVLESALVGFVPPFDRSKKGCRRRRFSEQEDAQLRADYDTGRTWAETAEGLGRSIGAVYARWVRLRLADAMEEALLNCDVIDLGVAS